jgi:putative Holliday junction resolvase
MKRHLGIDYGKKNIGVALSDDSGTLAFPKEILGNKGNATELIQSVCENEQIDTIVIGDPGNNSSIKEDVLYLAKSLKEAGYTIILEPEFMTSLHVDMSQKNTASGRRVEKDMTKKDDSAAALILQRYLDRRKND